MPRRYSDFNYSSRILLFLVFVALTSLPAAGAESLVINEVMTANYKTLADDDLEHHDWVEIFNSSTAPVSLENWYLTDDPQNLTKWQFPATNILAKGYLVVFASGKNRKVPGSPLHTSFALDRDGAYLALVKPDGATIASMLNPIPALNPEVSYGLAAGQLKYFSPATPGAANNTGFPGVAPMPRFSVAEGVYTNSVFVSVTTGTNNTEVRYTLNGTEPTSASLLFPTRLTIKSTGTLRVKVFQKGNVPSPAVSRNYFILAPEIAQNLTNYTSNLPIGIIDDHGVKNLQNDVIYPARFMMIEPFRGRTWFTNPPSFTGRGIFGIRGSSSAGFEKKQYKVELEDEGGNDKEAPLLGLASNSDWVFYGPYTDKTMIRDILAYDLGHDIGMVSPKFKFFELYLNQGGGQLSASNYAGVYVLLQKIKRGPDRVDIQKLRRTDQAMPNISGGYILKKDRLDPGDAGIKTTIGQYVLGLVEPKEEEITPEQRAWITAWLNEFETALTGPNSADPNVGYQKYIDVLSFIDNHLMVESAKNIDGYRLSTYMFKDRNGKMYMGPLWDYNLAYGNANYNDGANTANWYYPLVGATDYPWYTTLFNDPNFKQRYIDRWAELRKGPFATSNVLAKVQNFATLLDEAQVRNYKKWKILGTYVWPNSYIGQTYADEVNWMKGWISGRMAWIDSQWLPAPALNQNGGPITPGFQLTMSSPTGAVFYTLDGTDPRQSGGSISPKASLYTTAITLNDNARVFARTWLTNIWSAPTEATFYTRMPGLIISEIMYHPAGATGTSPYSSEDFEYLEIRNAGGRPEELSGVRIDGGVHFAFPHPSVSNNTNTAALSNPLIQPQYGSVQTAAGASTYQDFESTGSGTLYTSSAGAPPVAGPDAGSSGKFLQLTPATANQKGEILFSRASTAGSNVVSAQFDFRITPGSAGNRGEGIGFVYWDTAQSQLPINTGAAVSSEPNVPGSIGLGFDVRANAVSDAEPNDNHVSIHFNGAQVSPKPVSPSFDMADGRFHRASVTIRFGDGKAYVSLKLIRDVLGGSPKVESLYHDFEIPGAAPYEGRVAFGASNADKPAAHDIDNVNVKYSMAEPQVLWPGEYGVLVRNKAAFQSRYGTNITVLGEYQGELGNSGDHLKLTGSLQEPILDFHYDAGWYPMTDGYGFSLVLQTPVPPLSDFGLKSSWRPSGTVGGSPADVDPPPVTVPPIRINEILSNSGDADIDRIELFNPTDAAVNVTGWYLTDDRTRPKKFRFPTGTPPIPPGGYLVVDEKAFNPTPGKGTSFSFSSKGDEAYLFSADLAGNLTGYFDFVEFEAARQGESFIRYPLSTGEFDFTPASAATLGRANAAPILPRVVINELMFHPPDYVYAGTAYDVPEDEFIELFNPSTNSITLASTNGVPWKIKGGVSFTFATNTVIPARGYLLLVNFSSTNSTMLASFRKKYKVDPSIVIRGPYEGKLDNSRDRVGLYEPDPDDPKAEVMIDLVRYRDTAPWPVGADGTGKSIQRRHPATFGSEPMSWAVAAPTPGSLNAGSATIRITSQPASQRVAPGENVEFKVVAAGSGALRYQWRRESVSIPGATNAVLKINNAQPRDNGTYDVMVLDDLSMAISDSVTLVAVLDSDHDGIPDDWETSYGLNPNDGSDASADKDGDGMSNLAEFLAGTDPSDANSVLAFDSITFEGASVRLSFRAVAGRQYLVEKSLKPAGGNWSTVKDLAASATGSTDVIDGSPGNSPAFYRVQIKP